MNWVVLALLLLGFVLSPFVSTLASPQEPHAAVVLVALPLAFVLVVLFFRRRPQSLLRSAARYLFLAVLFVGAFALLYVVFASHPAVRASLLFLAVGAGGTLAFRFLRREASYASEA